MTLTIKSFTIKSLHKIMVHIEAEFQKWPTYDLPAMKTRLDEIYVANSDAEEAMAIALNAVGPTIHHTDRWDGHTLYEGVVLSKAISAVIPLYDLPVGIEIIFAQ